MTATPDLPAWIASILLTLEVLRRLPAALRNSRSRPLWIFFFALDMAMLAKIQSVGDFLYETTGVDDVAVLTKHIFGIAAVAGLLRWVTNVVPGRMDGRREPRYRMVISSNPRRIVSWLFVVAVVALFPMAQRRTGNQEDSDFIFVQAGHFWGSLQMLLFYAYLVFGLVCASLTCSATAREPSAKGAFKYGMQVMSLGCSCGSFYGILRSGYLIVRLFNKPFLGGDQFVNVTSDFALVSAVLLIVGGAAAPKLERIDHLIKAHAAINDLRPLWLTLTRAVPEVIYDDQVPHRRPTRTRDLLDRLYDFWNWKHLDLRLRKRIQEIHDASLHLAPYVPTDLRGRAETVTRELGLPSYVVTAYLLHTAIRRKKDHEEPCSGQCECEVILQATEDLFTSTSKLLPVGHAMQNPLQMGLINRRFTAAVHA